MAAAAQKNEKAFVYQWTGSDKQGRKVKGESRAAGESMVRAELRRQGVIPATIKRLLKGERPIVTGDGSQTKDFIYVDDTVKGLISILNNKNMKGEIINLAKENGWVSIKELVEILINLVGVKKSIKYVKDRTSDVGFQRANPTRAKILLGFEAKTTFIEGLTKTIEWWKKEILL